jgi:uncharacterized protein (TIGR02266 family)
MAIKQVLIGGGAEFIATAGMFFSNSKKFNVVSTEDGEAIYRMLATMPDLALLDIDLPKRGGDVCCKAAKRARLSPRTLIVLAAAPECPGAISRCLDAECDAFIPKPLKHERLAQIVTNLLFKHIHIPSRFPVRLPVRYGVQPHQLMEHHSANLNTDGLFVETENAVPEGSTLHVHFSLPDGGATVKCTARVAWVNDKAVRRKAQLPSGMGLEFLDLDDRQADAILDFLYQLAAT